MIATTTFTGRLTVLDCPACGVLFGITGEYEQRRRADTRNFFCPNGHTMSWHESEADRLRKQLVQAQREAANRSEDLSIERASHAATKGQLTKAKKRIANGMCPCCNRSFVQLQRHMASQHPDYVATEPPKH